MVSALKDRKEELASNDESLTTRRAQLATAKGEKADDEDFLEKLTAICAKKATEYEKRKVLRANEEAALAKAIAILNSDQAFENFGKVAATRTGAALSVGFLQVQRREIMWHGGAQPAPRQGELPPPAGGRPPLARPTNPFNTVFDEIEKALLSLVTEGQNDERKHGWCEDTQTDDATQLDKLKGDIATLMQEITDATNVIQDPEEGLNAQIDDIIKSLAANKANQNELTETRETEHAEFKRAEAAQVQAAATFAEAIAVLKEYYGKLAAGQAALAQRASAAGPAPPATWDESYSGQSGMGTSVIESLEYIMSETEKELQAARTAESESQDEYDEAMTSLSTAETDALAHKAKLENQLADVKLSIEEKTEALGFANASKAGVEKHQKLIKPECDFIQNNLAARQTHRQTEKTALEGAIELIKGTPAYMSAKLAAEHTAMGDCKETCVEAPEYVDCKSCLAGVTVAGYCAGHEGTPGC
eukprot:NODE_1640_length_2413_cov_4.852581.p2 GENE.NODE_1640_length_2413_cov_4.852581~~NODE_1640_length_2413_cov_4.852581.p2  ORF type:complete len:477 (-),score=175.25 NODE_1640_length_2413_cov_4.852581:116-1546(-)